MYMYFICQVTEYCQIPFSVSRSVGNVKKIKQKNINGNFELARGTQCILK